jgi:pilus assembly protein Flp/PilA
MRAWIHRTRLSTIDRGASAVEYGLLVAAIAAMIVGIVFGLGGIVSTTLQKTSDCIAHNAQPAADCSSGTPAGAPGP